MPNKKTIGGLLAHLIAGTPGRPKDYTGQHRPRKVLPASSGRPTDPPPAQ